jgi:hypothetical protein
MCENTESTSSNRGGTPVFNELLTLTFSGLLLLGVFPESHLMAQSDPAWIVSTLRKSTVYFVLPTATNKLAALKEEAARTHKSNRQKRLLNRIEAEQLEVDSFNVALRAAVSRHYSFSAYDFIADTSVKQLLSTKKTDPDIYLVRRATTESGADALVLSDFRMRPLSRPIPYYARLTRFSSFFDAFVGKDVFSWRDLNEVIRKWSARLETFAEGID